MPSILPEPDTAVADSPPEHFDNVWEMISSHFGIDIAFDDYVNCDDSVPSSTPYETTAPVSDEAPSSADQAVNDDNDDDDSDTDIEPKQSQIMNTAKAYSTLLDLRDFILQHSNAPAHVLSSLDTLEDFVISGNVSNLKQSKITSFFQ